MKSDLYQEPKKFYEEQKKFYLERYWKNNKNNIYQPNGFDSLPEDIYKAFCEQIDKNGKVLDLGCGNGLMLKYLIETSGYKLIPYGIDFMERSIRQAKQIIHPKYAPHFKIGNIIAYSFEDGPFDFIFTFIYHVHPADRENYLKSIKKNCKRNGKIIFYEYPDVLSHTNYSWIGEFPELKNWKLIRKDYPGVYIGIWKNK